MARNPGEDADPSASPATPPEASGGAPPFRGLPAPAPVSEPVPGEPVAEDTARVQIVDPPFTEHFVGTIDGKQYTVHDEPTAVPVGAVEALTQAASDCGITIQPSEA